MRVCCPECGSTEFVQWHQQLLCVNCAREFGPKCYECGREMLREGADWECPLCHTELPSYEVECINPTTSLIQQLQRKRERRRGKSKGLLALLLEAIFK